MPTPRALLLGCCVAAALGRAHQAAAAEAAGPGPPEAAAAAAAEAAAADAPPAESVYAVGEEYTVQTDASLVELAKTGGRQNLAAVEERLAGGADVNAKDQMGYTALHWSAVNGHADIARVLVEKGANIEAENDRGCTPLFLAAQNGQESVCDLLMENYANLDPQTSAMTPPDVARSNGFEELAMKMLVVGNDPHYHGHHSEAELKAMMDGAAASIEANAKAKAQAEAEAKGEFERPADDPPPIANKPAAPLEGVDKGASGWFSSLLGGGQAENDDEEDL